jgi:hypothetical protein
MKITQDTRKKKQNSGSGCAKQERPNHQKESFNEDKKALPNNLCKTLDENS